MTCLYCGVEFDIKVGHRCPELAKRTYDSKGRQMGKTAKTFDQAVKALEQGCTVWCNLPDEGGKL